MDGCCASGCGRVPGHGAAAARCSTACRRSTSWAARCATSCSASGRSTSTWRSRATRVGAAQELADTARRPRASARALRHRHGHAADGLRFDLAATRTRDLPRARRAAGGRAGRAGRGPGPARLRRQRHGGRPARRRSGPPARPHWAASATWRQGVMRVLHDRLVPRRPHAPAARRALRDPARTSAWTADSEEPPARRWPRARSTPSPARGCATSCCDLLGETEAAAEASSASATSASTRPCTRAARRGRAGGSAASWARWRPAPTARWRRWPRWPSLRARGARTGSAAGAATPRPRRGAARGAARPTAAGGRAARPRRRPSELRALLRREPPEALALALALGAPAEPVLRWVGDLQPLRLEITRRRPDRGRHRRRARGGRRARGDAAAQAGRRRRGRDEELEPRSELAREGS